MKNKRNPIVFNIEVDGIEYKCKMNIDEYNSFMKFRRDIELLMSPEWMIKFMEDFQNNKVETNMEITKEEYDKPKSFYDKNFEKMLSMIDFKEMYFDSFNADEIIKAKVNGSDVYIVSNRVDLSKAMKYFDSKEIDLINENNDLRMMYDGVSSDADMFKSLLAESNKKLDEFSKKVFQIRIV